MSNRLVIALCAMLSLALASTASAQELSIASVHPDVTAGVLVIDGTGFRQGLSVSLEGHDLKVVSVKAREVKTALPSLTPGTYRLAMRQWFDSARFIVAIGGVPAPAPQAGAPALTVVAANGAVLGNLVGVTKLFGADPAMVARQDHGLWVTFALDATGVMVRYYPIFYTGDGCTGSAYAFFESNPAPLVRSVQRMSATDTTGFYPGNPPQSLSFPSMRIADSANPDVTICVAADANGWGGSLYVGPLQTIDLSQFPSPFAIE